MKLYYRPGACSLASCISLYEAGLKFDLVKVDRETRRAADGLDFNEVNPKGYVPALTLDNGETLTENVAVLQYIADRNPAAKLAPAAGTMERYRLIEWLAFINSEVHKNFGPLFRKDAPDDTKAYARQNIATRAGWLNGNLGSRSYLMGEQFTVADAYLFVVLGWGAHVGIDIAQWPKLQALVARVGARPHVLAALKAEGLTK
ncbi:MAG TPA: glutathione transferase GstA [Steroidobacteraceae bacterium]|jgi:glutathione S-transferase